MTMAVWTEMATTLSMAMVMLAIFLMAVRLLRGPSLSDRVLALDTIATAGIGLVALIAAATGMMIAIDIAIALGLISFLATVAFARFVLLSRSKAAARGTGDRP